MPHLEALILRLDASLHHPLAKGTHRRHRVVKYLVAKVARAAVQGGHLGQRGRVGRLQTLVGGHAHGTTCRRNQDNVGAHLQDGLFALLEAGTVLSGGAIVPAHVQVHDSSAGINGRFCLTNDFFYSIGHIGILLLCNLSATDCGSDNQFIHCCELSIFNF